VPKVSGPNHWGSRLVFARDGTLFVTTGDRFAHRERAQDLATTIGKVIRINADGSIPQDNPFVKRGGARPEIWSYGHRNVQAATLHPQTGQLWTVEHGARGGDELNHPQAGKNYAGRSSPTVSIIPALESARVKPSLGWNNPSITGIP